MLPAITSGYTHITTPITHIAEQAKAIVLTTILLFAGLLSLTLLLPLSALAQSSATPQTLKLVTQHFPPYSMCEGNVVKPSFFVSAVTSACAEAGLTCELTCHPNRRSKLMLRTGEAHGNYPMGWNADRDNWLRWSPALHSEEYGFYQNNKDDYRALKDLRGKTVGVFGPSNMHKWLQRLQQQLLNETGDTFKIALHPKYSGANMSKLSLGRIDAVFINRGGGDLHIEEAEVENVEFAFGIKKLNYYVAFSIEKNKGERLQLIERFNQGIEQIKTKGILETILKQYGMSASIYGVR